MNEVHSIPDLLTHLRSLPAPVCLGIEGFCGSGKTFLASQLAAELPAERLDTDTYVTTKDSNLYYPDVLDLEGLAEALTRLKQNRTPAILAGICLRDIAQRVNVQVRPFIYVRKVAPSGLWHDLLHLEDFERTGGRSRFLKEPHLSDMKYHSAGRPHEKADIVLVRREQESDA